MYTCRQTSEQLTRRRENNISVFNAKARNDLTKPSVTAEQNGVDGWVSINVLSALPLKHSSSLAQRTVFYHFLPVKTVCRGLFYYLFVDLWSQIAFSFMCWPWAVHFSLLPSSLFSSSRIWCCCSPHCPKTLDSARIPVQPCEKLHSSQLLPIFCKPHPSLPFISGPHLPQFIFQQVHAIIASSTGCAHGLLTLMAF